MEESKIAELLADPQQRKVAFSELVKNYQERIYYFTRRMILDHDDTNDIIQTVFMKAWSALDNFRGDSKISTWLFRIAYNESISFLRKQQRISGIRIDDIETQLGEKLEADVYYDGDEMQTRLQVAVASLPEKQKAVFVMKYFEEKKYDEISAITGTSVGALKASYHHAVHKIEENLRRGLNQ